MHPRKAIVLEGFLQPENCILVGAKKRTHCMQAYLWTSGNTLPLKDEHLTSDCRIKCHLHTCTKWNTWHFCLCSCTWHPECENWTHCEDFNLHYFICCMLTTHVLFAQCQYHTNYLLICPFRRFVITTAQISLILFELPTDACCCCLCFSARHEVITKEILELDTWENQWNVVATNVLMHDSYDVCLVARLNPRDLIPPPPDLVDQ